MRVAPGERHLNRLREKRGPANLYGREKCVQRLQGKKSKSVGLERENGEQIVSRRGGGITYNCHFWPRRGRIWRREKRWSSEKGERAIFSQCTKFTILEREDFHVVEKAVEKGEGR